DGNYATSSGTVDQKVFPADTKTTVTINPSPSVFNQSVTITATVTDSPSTKTPTGSVVFTLDGNQTNPVGLDNTGKAQITVTFTTLGEHKISAAYTSNDTNKFLSSSSSQVTQQVNAAPTTVSVSASPSPSQVGAPVTFAATVSAPSSTATPTGSVTFVIDGSSQATVDVDNSGHASFITSSLS